MRQKQGSGVGSFTCGNCKYLTEKDTDGYTCLEDGVGPNDLPCALDSSWFAGEFVPVSLGPTLTTDKSFASIVGTLDRGDLQLAQYLIDIRDEQLMYEIPKGVEVGAKVVVDASGITHQAEVTGFAKDGKVNVVTTKGVKLSVYPGSVSPKPQAETAR
jgi:hypothetical protein